MSFELKQFLGTEEANEEDWAGVFSITKGDMLYWLNGYLDNTYGSVTCALLAGVAMQTVDNSAGSAGDLSIQYQPSPLAIYDVGTADTMTQAYVGVNAALASATTVTSASAGDDTDGIFRIMKMLSASKVRGRLNFTPEAD